MASPDRSLTPTIAHSLFAGALAAFLSAPLPAPARADNWKPVYESEHLVVQKRDYKGSALNEIKGVTRIEATLNAAMALLKDAAFNEQWVYRSGGARILEEVGYAQVYVYGVVDAPWPMRDRDTVVRFDYQQDPLSKAIAVGITNFPAFTSPNSEFVRVPKFGGQWRLNPQAGGWLEVIYQVYGDPGGLIPIWIANQAAALSVKNTLLNMSTAVKRYEGARSEFVEEVSSSH